MTIKDYTGQRFGKLVAIRNTGRAHKERCIWVLQCDCGNVVERTAGMMDLSKRRGDNSSCGCALGGSTRTHACSKTTEYEIWAGMRCRCNNPANGAYKNYGGRGISVCKRWDDFSLFLADMGKRPTPLHSLDRIDNNGHYEPANCRWTGKTVQMINRRLCATNKSGTKGISWDDNRQQWRASLTVYRKQVFSKRFDLLEDAIAARKAAELKYFSDILRREP